MITIESKEKTTYQVTFDGKETEKHFPNATPSYQALHTLCFEDGRMLLSVGKGKQTLGIRQVKELLACAAKKMKEEKIEKYEVDISLFVENIGVQAVAAAAEGVYEGTYEILLPGEEENSMPEITFSGIPYELQEEAAVQLEKGCILGQAQVWAKHLVNAPGNLLHPMDFARSVMEKMETVSVECELFVYSKLNAMGMHALTSVGKSSENPPCMLVMRYLGNPDTEQTTGLVGKGVTCDTGGYCLKPANSMMGIKGDMAGGAAVASTIFSLAKNHAKTNVIGVIPMCENRISTSSLVPGDVISSYSGKKIEICNSDAEGRLILADAVSYLVKNEKVDAIIDIATLTGAVVNMFGFSTAGTLSNDDEFYQQFSAAAKKSGERYWRLPIFEEQENMIKSEIADIKNMGKDYCGTITAGLFVREFTEGKPWIHVDIAGTAWVDSPLYSGQAKGATGAGISTLYYMLEERD